jgi:hypothetical protein
MDQWVHCHDGPNNFKDGKQIYEGKNLHKEEEAQLIALFV